MSSPQRDVGEALREIARDIPKDLENMTVEEMRRLLAETRSYAIGAYADYAEYMGWVEDRADAISEFDDEVRYVASDDAPVSDVQCIIPTQTIPEIPKIPITPTLFEATLTEWFSGKISVGKEVSGIVTQETGKAYKVEVLGDNPYFGWIPKSQVIRFKRV